MTIRILCVGKIKEAFYRDAMAELIKRMGRYAAAEVIEVAEEKAPEGLSAAEKERILASEGERLLGKTDERDHVTALCIMHRGQKADERGICRAYQRRHACGQKPHGVHNRRLLRPAPERKAPRGHAAFVQRYDIPASALPRYARGANIPRVQNKQ